MYAALDLEPHRSQLPEFAHGLGNWPWSVPYAPALPGTIFGARPWPRVSVLTVANAGTSDLESTVLSVERQAYPNVEHILEGQQAGEDPQVAWQRAFRKSSGAFVLCLPLGDMLAPGALASASLMAVIDEADIIVGLRVVFDTHGVESVDILDLEPGPLRLDAWTDAGWAGADIMVARTFVGATAKEHSPQRTARVASIGRPMVLHRSREVAEPEISHPPHLSIAALSDSGAGGGASIAHSRLIDSLRLAGHRVETKTLSTKASPATAEWVDKFPEVEQEIIAGGFDMVLTGNIHGATRRADVLARLNAHVPVAAVMHDMFLLTGRCDVPLDCKLIHTKCTSACPTPTFYPYLAPNRIEGAWSGKRAFLSMSPAPILLANSHWTEHFAKSVLGPELAHIVHRIHLPFPAQVFRPRQRQMLRRSLGLSETDILIMFAAVVSDNPQKGLGDVLATLKTLAGPGIGFVVIGRIDDPAALHLPNLCAPGPIADEDRLAEWFAACDLHVIASRFESLGQTPIEAGLCGTPTIAYRRTGLSTAVIDGISGLLADPDLASFNSNVRRLVGDAEARSALGALGHLALEARNSHAASYLTILKALRGYGLIGPAQPSARVRFDPEILNTFEFATDRRSGASGTVSGAPNRAIRTLRRLKHKIWGRTMPFWMRFTVRMTKRVYHLSNSAVIGRPRPDVTKRRLRRWLP
jgi:glycosyltransferase involved in cell wall biosynthesis